MGSTAHERFDPPPGAGGHGATAREQSSDTAALHARLLAAVGQAVVATRLDGTVVYWNAAAEALTGWAAEEVVGRVLDDVVPAQREGETAVAPLERLARGESEVRQLRLQRRDGTWVTTMVMYAPWSDDAGELLGVIAVSLDASELVTMERRAARRAEAQAAVAALGQKALRSGDLDAFLADAVDTVAKAVDVPVASVLEAHQGGGYLRVRASLPVTEGDEHSGRSFPVEPGSRLEEALRSGTTVVVDELSASSGPWSAWLVAGGLHTAVIAPLSSRGQVIGCLVACGRDREVLTAAGITVVQSIANIVAAAFERDRSDRELQHQALHDQLTGLPNRALFTDRLEHALLRRFRQGGQVALLFSDLDRFKQVNDSLGHAAGDRLLVAVATRMRSVVRASDTVARLSGDEFAVLCEELGGVDDAMALAQRLAVAFAAPFSIDGHDLQVSASIGVAVAGDDDTPDSLLRHADQAMYEAKQSGRNRVSLFRAELATSASERRSTAAALREAGDAGQLLVHYQTVHDLRSGAVAAAEALLRWRHPERGLLTPPAFLAVAEDSGALLDIGRWGLERVCRDASGWVDQGGPPAVAVNLSPRQLAHPDLPATVTSALAARDLDPQRLWLEVTEEAVMRHVDDSARTLRTLAEHGVRLAIDDFGTGSSSLAVLRRLPLSAIKVDRAFVSGAGPGLRDRSVVAAATGMARGLGVLVVAEGVETAQQVAELRELGCDWGQGFYWAVPAAAEALASLDR